MYDQVDIQKGIIMGMQYATTMAAEPSAELRTQKSKEVDSEGGDVVATVSVAMPKVLSLKHKVRASETEVPASEMNAEDAFMF